MNCESCQLDTCQYCPIAPVREKIKTEMDRYRKSYKIFMRDQNGGIIGVKEIPSYTIKEI